MCAKKRVVGTEVFLAAEGSAAVAVELRTRTGNKDSKGNERRIEVHSRFRSGKHPRKRGCREEWESLKEDARDINLSHTF